MPEHTNKKEGKKKKDFLAAALGKSPYLDRAMSSPLGRMSLNVRRVETDLFFLNSLSCYQFNGQRLALLAFYLTTCTPSWPVLKCLLAMAFFFFPSKDRGNGWERTPATPPAPALHRPPLRGARDPGALQNTVWETLAGQKSWLPEFPSLSWLCCCFVNCWLFLISLSSRQRVFLLFLENIISFSWFPPLFCNQILTDTLLLFSEADLKVSW